MPALSAPENQNQTCLLSTPKFPARTGFPLNRNPRRGVWRSAFRPRQPRANALNFLLRIRSLNDASAPALLRCFGALRGM